MIVADSSGTTRDSVDTRLDLDGERFTLIDTAGLRRAARRDPGVEYWSALRSERAIARSDVVLLVIEAGEAGTAQDARIAALCEEMGRGIILVVNKWDLVPAESREREAWERYLRREFRFIAYAPIAYVSAVTGTGVKQLLPLAARIWRERRRRIPDDRVEDILMNAVRRRPPSGNGRRGVLFAARQTGFAPPLFALNVNYPALFEDEYMRYLVNRMRREIPFEGTPIRFDLRTGRPRDARDAGNGEKTERSRGRKGRAGTRVRE
jgi:GTP-binding protein